MEFNIEGEDAGKGQNGLVMNFDKSGTSVAAKRILRSQGEIYIRDCYLKELFCAKFASALGVGPQFYDFYGYDMIALKNYC